MIKHRAKTKTPIWPEGSFMWAVEQMEAGKVVEVYELPYKMQKSTGQIMSINNLGQWIVFPLTATHIKATDWEIVK